MDIAREQDRKHTFKKGNHSNEPCVVGVTFPLGNNDRVLGVRRCVFFAGVQRDNFRKVPIQVGKILYANKERKKNSLGEGL